MPISANANYERDGVLRDINTDLPVCLRCGEVIVDEEYHFVASHPERGEIEMGPYHEDCWPYVKVCVKCNTPHMVDREEEISHLGKGEWVCHTCLEKMEICSHCKGESTSFIEHEGKKYCKDCFKVLFVNCKVLKKVLPRYHFSEIEKKGWASIFKDYKYSDISYAGFTVLKVDYEEVAVGECEYCSCIHTLEDLRDGFCLTCVSNGDAEKCTVCGKYFKTYTHDSSLLGVCLSCKPKVAACFITYKVLLKKDMGSLTNAKGTFYYSKKAEKKGLLKKYKECPTCHKYVEKGHLSTSHGITYCTYCKEKLGLCGVCNKPHLGEHFCRGVEDSNPSNSNYSFKPIPIFHSTKKDSFKKGGIKDSLYMGFENEQSYSTEKKRRKALANIYTRFPVTTLYCKSDSSIQGRGVEVVTHPHTLMAFGKMPLSYLFKQGIDKREDNGCGMHIHLSRSFFTDDLHIFKFISFINDDDNKSLITLIAQRYGVEYSHKIRDIASGVKGSSRSSSSRKREARDRKSSIPRHSFVNLCNKDTVEVRIFRGANNRIQILQRLQFVHALAYFTKCIGIKGSVDKSLFLSFVNKSKDKYKLLLDLIG